MRGEWWGLKNNPVMREFFGQWIPWTPFGASCWTFSTSLIWIVNVRLASQWLGNILCNCRRRLLCLKISPEKSKTSQKTRQARKRLKHWENPSLRWQRPSRNLLLIIASDTRLELSLQKGSFPQKWVRLWHSILFSFKVYSFVTYWLAEWPNELSYSL